jgi:hypothetical protein
MAAAVNMTLQVISHEEDITVIKAALDAMGNIEDVKVTALSDVYYGENVL